MRHFLSLLALLGATAITPAYAQDFSAESKAKSWGLYGERKARFEGRVTDALCEITGDCPADCGGGFRQMGILRSVDGVFVLALKNSQAAFSGAAVDLALYCNQMVEVDGLIIEEPDLGSQNVFQIQKIRVGDGKWAKANQFTKVWKQETPEAAGKGAWFRRDPRIKALIARDGYLGLGLATDEAFIKEWFE